MRVLLAVDRALDAGDIARDRDGGVQEGDAVGLLGLFKYGHAVVVFADSALQVRGGRKLGNVEIAPCQGQAGIGDAVRSHQSFADIARWVEAGERDYRLHVMIGRLDLVEHILAEQGAFGLLHVDAGQYLGVGHDQTEQLSVGGWQRARKDHQKRRG